MPSMYWISIELIIKRVRVVGNSNGIFRSLTSTFSINLLQIGFYRRARHLMFPPSE